MYPSSYHTFHIPVMGLGFTIDTPVKVAHFGISSVISIVEDHLIEQMREVLCRDHHMEYTFIPTAEEDFRAVRITKYLNLVNTLVEKNVQNVKQQAFGQGTDLSKYFELLPDDSELKQLYNTLPGLDSFERPDVERLLRMKIIPGEIDVNIMTKVDKINYSESGEQLPAEFSDALSALRGFAKSDLSSSVIFSAGLNPRLYSYCENFPDFFPDESGFLKKRIVLKVSDYRSALIQGKFLVKKGLWVSEFRIESGLNCGGHAFATNGTLLGPILEEFKLKRDELYNELYSMCKDALSQKDLTFHVKPHLKITAQGGLGTSGEDKFLAEYYDLDSTGWGSPFLLVPEVTNVDEETLRKLSVAEPGDYYLSNSSPLGVPFNNFRHSSSEVQRKTRIAKNRPGSPCYKKFLSSNTEFTSKPICTASREYQNHKIKEAQNQYTEKELEKVVEKIMEKDCLCEGLGASALIGNKTKLSHGLKAVAICPGPNLAYFSGIFTLKQMVDHIYGRTNLLNTVNRPHVFINELKLYVEYFKKERDTALSTITQKQAGYLKTFKENLLQGIDYYTVLLPVLKLIKEMTGEMQLQLQAYRQELELMVIETGSGIK